MAKKPFNQPNITDGHIQAHSNTDTFSNQLSFHECSEPWYAIHVRSRHEKCVAEELITRKVVHYLPLIERQKKWSDRRVFIKEPAFPGYIFVNIPYEDRIPVLETKGVVQLIGSNGQPWSIPAEEIEAVYKALNSKLKCDLYPNLKVGTEVYVTRGPLKGCHGQLIEKNKKHRLIFSVQMIGQSLAVEINAADVKPL